jgi:hypothetical protein
MGGIQSIKRGKSWKHVTKDLGPAHRNKVGASIKPKIIKPRKNRRIGTPFPRKVKIKPGMVPNVRASGRALRGWGLPFSKNYKRTSKPLFYYAIQAVVNCTLLVINYNASSHLTTRTPGTAISSTSPHQGSALPCNHWEISASVRLVSVRPGRVLG